MSKLKVESDVQLIARVQKKDQKFVNTTLSGPDHQLEIAEIQIRNLKNRLIRFAKDDQRKDRYILSLETQVKQLNQKVVDLKKQLEDSTALVDHTRAEQKKHDNCKLPPHFDEAFYDVQSKTKTTQSKLCIIL
ncbi:uncharacterized protein LOC130625615 [Hydractinia symbiolongicarpus]|uniref:uncharacterized protein LOC130625615 n=1 Tax=Hydractinia symbiolongicarpus TaxID=13093 RepID=UPI00254A3283|nr:uncharacterized protein LOC130625615 [Hydractinia symbiolongicarpus]